MRHKLKNKLGIITLLVALIAPASMQASDIVSLQEFVQDSKKTLPHKIDDNTTLVNISIEKNTITYTIRLNKERKEGDVKKERQEKYCALPSNHPIKYHKATLIMKYVRGRGKNAKPLYTITISPKTGCSNNDKP